MTTHKPKVSVIVPNYNHAKYLRPRLDSVYNQTYTDFEVILLDDCSTDESKVILEEYAQRPHTRFVPNTQNSGSVFFQWKKGIELAEGELIWIAESDDFASPYFLQTLVPLLEDNPQVGVAYAQSWLINLEGEILGDGTIWTNDIDSMRWKNNFVNEGAKEIAQCMLFKNTIPNASAALIRKASLKKAGGVIKEKYRLCGDWLQWIRILSVSDIAYSPLCLNFWRQHSSNARMKSPGTLEWIEGETVLREGCQILHYTNEKTDQVLLIYLRKCWEWQKGFIEDVLLKENGRSS